MDESPQVIKNSAEHRFEIRGDEATAILTYRENARHITLVHTEVPEALEGRGYGGQLARAALEYAKAAGIRVIPVCAFVRSFIERHPEYADLTK